MKKQTCSSLLVVQRAYIAPLGSQQLHHPQVSYEYKSQVESIRVTPSLRYPINIAITIFQSTLIKGISFSITYFIYKHD